MPAAQARSIDPKAGAAAQKTIEAFADRFDLPVAPAFRYQDYFDNRHRCYVGCVGIGVDPKLAAAVKDADMVVGLSLGNDQLGYYEPAHAFVFANGEAPYHSDHLQYNISPVFGDEEIQTQVSNLGAVGFGTNTFTLCTPENNNWAQAAHPGLQAMAYPEQGDACLVYTSDAADASICATLAVRCPL